MQYRERVPCVHQRVHDQLGFYRPMKKCFSWMINTYMYEWTADKVPYYEAIQ